MLWQQQSHCQGLGSSVHDPVALSTAWVALFVAQAALSTAQLPCPWPGLLCPWFRWFCPWPGRLCPWLRKFCSQLGSPVYSLDGSVHGPGGSVHVLETPSLHVGSTCIYTSHSCSSPVGAQESTCRPDCGSQAGPGCSFSHCLHCMRSWGGTGAWNVCCLRPASLAGPECQPSGRCVSLQIQDVLEAVDREPPGVLVLLNEMEHRLQDLEERFLSCGYKEKGVEIRLERARVKRCDTLQGYSGPCAQG